MITSHTGWIIPAIFTPRTRPVGGDARPDRRLRRGCCTAAKYSNAADCQRSWTPADLVDDRYWPGCRGFASRRLEARDSAWLVLLPAGCRGLGGLVARPWGAFGLWEARISAALRSDPGCVEAQRRGSSAAVTGSALANRRTWRGSRAGGCCPSADAALCPCVQPMDKDQNVIRLFSCFGWSEPVPPVRLERTLGGF